MHSTVEVSNQPEVMCLPARASTGSVALLPRSAAYYCPRRGLPRSSATILIDLVCLFVCCLLSEILPKFAEEGSAGFIQSSVCVISRPSKTGPEKNTFKKLVKTFPGPRFLTFFSKINISKTPCPEGVCRRRYHSVNLVCER